MLPPKPIHLLSDDELEALFAEMFNGDGEAAREHLANGNPIYVSTPDSPRAPARNASRTAPGSSCALTSRAQLATRATRINLGITLRYVAQGRRAYNSCVETAVSAGCGNDADTARVAVNWRYQICCSCCNDPKTERSEGHSGVAEIGTVRPHDPVLAVVVNGQTTAIRERTRIKNRRISPATGKCRGTPYGVPLISPTSWCR